MVYEQKRLHNRRHKLDRFRRGRQGDNTPAKNLFVVVRDKVVIDSTSTFIYLFLLPDEYVGHTGFQLCRVQNTVLTTGSSIQFFVKHFLLWLSFLHSQRYIQQTMGETM